MVLLAVTFFIGRVIPIDGRPHDPIKSQDTTWYGDAVGKWEGDTLVVDIVGRAMQVCGIAGYREDSPYSLSRELRDAYGASLMVNNDRIYARTAQMLLIAKDL